MSALRTDRFSFHQILGANTILIVNKAPVTGRLDTADVKSGVHEHEDEH